MSTQTKSRPLDTDGSQEGNEVPSVYSTSASGESPHAADIRTVKQQKIAAIPWYSANESYDLQPPDVDWYVRGLLAEKSITELDGKVKRAGKTTFALASCKAILNGENFLGYTTKHTKIVYVTEQNPRTFTGQMRLAGIDGEAGEDIRIIYAPDLWVANPPWDELIDGITNRALQWGAGIIVIDTLAKLGGVTRENEGEQWAAAMTPLQQAASAGPAIFALRHSGKSNNVQVGDSGRGHSSASGDVDIILQLRDAPDQYPKNYRQLDGIGRYGDEIPDEILISFSEGAYENLGAPNDVSISTAQDFILGALSKHPNGLRLTTPKDSSDPSLVSLGNEADPKVNKTMLNRALAALTRDDLIHEETLPQKGAPKAYFAGPPSILQLLKGEKS